MEINLTAKGEKTPPPPNPSKTGSSGVCVCGTFLLRFCYGGLESFGCCPQTQKLVLFGGWLRFALMKIMRLSASDEVPSFFVGLG